MLVLRIIRQLLDMMAFIAILKSLNVPHLAGSEQSSGRKWICKEGESDQEVENRAIN